MRLATALVLISAATLAADAGDPAGTAMLELEPGASAPLEAPEGANLLCDDTSVVTPDFEAEEPAWLPRELHWVIGGTHRGGPAGVGPVRNPFGSNMSFRREVLDEVGGFTPTLGRGGSAHLCCEETELSIRVAQRRSGSVLLHVPDAVVTHSVPPARTTWGYLIRRSWIEGRSKAMVAHNVGSASGLRSERAYVARVLPAGVARGLRDAVLGDVDGLRRAAAIVAALATTVLGYACGVLEAREPG